MCDYHIKHYWIKETGFCFSGFWNDEVGEAVGEIEAR